MSQHTQNLDEYGIDLLASMVALEPHKRISCRMAMQHPYFDDLDKSKLAKDFWGATTAAGQQPIIWIIYALKLTTSSTTITVQKWRS